MKGMLQKLKDGVKNTRQAVRSIISPGQAIMVSVDGETYQITKDHKNFAKVEALVKRQKWAEVFSILGAAREVKVFTDGDITVEGDVTLYKGKPVSEYVGQKLVAMIGEGSSDFGPLARFLEKLMQNPDTRVQDNLYKFLEHGNIPLTADGDFLGYKSVRADYLDVHSGKFDNTPGNIVRMDRKGVVCDPNQGCSSGLHVGVIQYVGGFGGAKTVVVKVDPRNVVSVPADYSFQKMRTCEYYVVGDLQSNKPLESEVYQVIAPADAPVSTGEGLLTKRKVEKHAPLIPKAEKYVSPKAGPLRDENGRFIKRKVSKGPQRDENGRFLKKQ